MSTGMLLKHTPCGLYKNINENQTQNVEVSYLVFKKAEMPKPIFKLEYYSYGVANFGRTPILSGLRRTARLNRIYLPAARADPAPKLTGVIGPGAYVHTLLGNAHDDAVEILELINLYFPIMDTRTYAD